MNGWLNGRAHQLGRDGEEPAPAACFPLCEFEQVTPLALPLFSHLQNGTALGNCKVMVRVTASDSRFCLFEAHDMPDGML